MNRSFYMKIYILALLLFQLPNFIYPFTDESHYSETFGETRYYRVFTPHNYRAGNVSKLYPVIYYFHGCGGSYQASGTYSYQDYGLSIPEVIGKEYHPTYDFPNNVELENFVHDNEVIIISVDGSIADLSGCGVYFPSQADSWDRHYYNFSVYIKELISVVDSKYNTISDPQYRAVSGLSMGGHMALWVAATNPQLFSSVSEFCHSPAYYDVGNPAFQTTVDIMQLWRNFRGINMRHTTTDRDYLKYYTDQLAASFMGAGFKNEYYLADYCKHHAARIDLQFDYHLKMTTEAKQAPACFSHINLYPTFEVWDYHIASTKTGNGWIYLHDVTKNGMGIYTRKRLPYGNSLPEFSITLTTPEHYRPNEHYKLSRYSYDDDSFSDQNIRADSLGKIRISSSGGMGEEIGIIGKGLEPPVFVLTDTINENIYLTADIETPLSFEVVNLSNSSQEVDFTVITDNETLLTLDKAKTVIIPAQSKIHVDSLVTITGRFDNDYQNTGYIRISARIKGVIQQREHIIRVVVKRIKEYEKVKVKVFDGKSEDLTLYKYQWNEWDNPLTVGSISVGVGNGNGLLEPGETFSVWITTPVSFDESDTASWHPTVPVNDESNPDVSIEEIIQHRYNTGRSLLSAQIKLNRKPTKTNPIHIPIQAELLKVVYLENDCHRNTADGFKYVFYDLMIHHDGSTSISQKGTR